MNKTSCTIRFLCPAFLGDAHQQAAWRTPAFKAELRQWWRIVMAARGMHHRAIRDQEAHLFGNAWPDQSACKSRVRLRLSHWRAGKLSGQAPPVGKISNGSNQVDGGLYLGYGAIAYDKGTGSTKFAHEPAIGAGEAAELSIGIVQPDSEDEIESIHRALALMSRYGTVGSRSRNAWGSFVLKGDQFTAMDQSAVVIDWQDALAHEWARGIGRDADGPLIWRTRTADTDWSKPMRALAQLRSDINRSVDRAAERALLSYPVTKSTFKKWCAQERLPNSLRLKIVEEDDVLYGLVFHMPCKPKHALHTKHPYDQDGLARVWQSVHRQLDHSSELQRVLA